MKEYEPPCVSVIEMDSPDEIICASPVLGTEEIIILLDGEW